MKITNEMVSRAANVLVDAKAFSRDIDGVTALTAMKDALEAALAEPVAPEPDDRQIDVMASAIASVVPDRGLGNPFRAKARAARTALFDHLSAEPPDALVKALHDRVLAAADDVQDGLVAGFRALAQSSR